MRTFKPKACVGCESIIEPRSASHIRCDPCRKAKVAQGNRAYRQANLERLALSDKARYEANREKMNAQNKARRIARKDELAEIKRAYYLANRDAILERERLRYEAEAERIKGVQRAYRATRPDAVKARGSRRRARKAGVGREPYKPSAIYERDNWSCGICSESIDRLIAWPDAMSPSIDHVVPLSAGGPDAPGNVQAAHLGCNIRKGARVTTAVA